ncbi:hypothetical protein [Paraburkholderia tropica]|uniref:hypothetical protein n=1 Tax=Paraburkholderia tropica TaxID=92647 RepID=UPI001CC3D966|nr:hypothetical protein [Paraburkholderia tropica]
MFGQGSPARIVGEHRVEDKARAGERRGVEEGKLAGRSVEAGEDCGGAPSGRKPLGRGEEGRENPRGCENPRVVGASLAGLSAHRRAIVTSCAGRQPFRARSERHLVGLLGMRAAFARHHIGIRFGLIEAAGRAARGLAATRGPIGFIRRSRRLVYGLVNFADEFGFVVVGGFVGRLHHEAPESIMPVGHAWRVPVAFSAS